MAVIGTLDAAKRLGITRTRIAVLIRAGQLSATKIGRDWLIEEAELERFAKRERPPGRPKKPKS